MLCSSLVTLFYCHKILAISLEDCVGVKSLFAFSVEVSNILDMRGLPVVQY